MHWPSDLHPGGKLNFKNRLETENAGRKYKFVNQDLFCFESQNKAKAGLCPAVLTSTNGRGIRPTADLWPLFDCHQSHQFLIFNQVYILQSNAHLLSSHQRLSRALGLFSLLSLFCSHFQQQSSFQQRRLDKDSAESFNCWS